MTALLFYGDTERSPAMRHELPVTIGDPFLLGVVDGQLHVMASDLERSRVEVVAPDAVLDYDALGFRELLGTGISRHELELELASRAVAAMGIREATVDPEMPVAVADRLRADGIFSMRTTRRSRPGDERSPRRSWRAFGGRRPPPKPG